MWEFLNDLDTLLIVGLVLNTQSLPCALGFALSLDPSANTGNDLRICCISAQAKRFFAFTGLGLDVATSIAARAYDKS